jgi:hypothetical protein
LPIESLSASYRRTNVACRRVDEPRIDIEKVEIALKKAAIRAVYGSREDRSGRFLRVHKPVMTAIEYNEDQSTLVITFANEKTYRYLDVPADVYVGLRNTESKSVFFYDNIRDVFACAEVISA